jgi:hypothetical protein
VIPEDPFDRLRAAGFDLAARNHAEAILRADFAPALNGLADALLAVSIPAEELIRGGGGEARSTQRLRRALAGAGWPKHVFTIRKFIDDRERESTSHEIDHVWRGADGVIALEIEWNNKDPFFDRDLENFQRLHAEGAISVGVIVTRGLSMQAALYDILRAAAQENGLTGWDSMDAFDLNPTRAQRAEVERRIGAGATFAEAWARMFTASKFGAATTHWAKLEERLRRGVGAPCPLLLLGLPAAAVGGAPVGEDDQPGLW